VNTDVFERVFAHRRELKSSDITITPATTSIRARETLLVNGKTKVLSIPIEIRNVSPRTILTNLAHEWYGGIWPETDLYVAAKPLAADAGEWSFAPGYQVGELGSKGASTTLKPGEAQNLDIRLNWPGTGSVATEPLISESVPGKYLVKFLLFFRSNAVEKHMETTDFELEVEE